MFPNGWLRLEPAFAAVADVAGTRWDSFRRRDGQRAPTIPASSTLLSAEDAAGRRVQLSPSVAACSSLIGVFIGAYLDTAPEEFTKAMSPESHPSVT